MYHCILIIYYLLSKQTIPPSYPVLLCLFFIQIPLTSLVKLKIIKSSCEYMTMQPLLIYWLYTVYLADPLG